MEREREREKTGKERELGVAGSVLLSAYLPT